MAQSQKPRKTSKSEDAQKEASKHQASAGYDIILSRAAEAAYEGFYQRAAEARDRGDVTSSHYTALNMIDQVIEDVIPRDPFNKKYALQGELSGIFRMQKGRLRICWMGSSKVKKIYVVFISETLRKEGDANDPYRLLTSMVLSGQFNEFFEMLGLTPPKAIRSGSYLTH